MKKFNMIITAFLLILVPIAFVSAQQQDTTEQQNQTDLVERPNAEVEGPFIEVADQNVMDNTVIVNYVMSNGPGWVVIHKGTEDGVPGEVLGYTHVADGEHENVEVQLDSEPEGALVAMLHNDNEPVGTYEFPGSDMPAKKIDHIVMMGFETFPLDQLGAEEATQTETEGEGEAKQQ